MTVEELSSATASRYETKMLHDVKSSARVRSPPRPDPPMFGRESMEDAVSARAVAAETPPPPPSPPATPGAAVSAKATSTEDEIDAFFAIFQRVEPQLHAFLSDADKKRIRRALHAPSSSGPALPMNEQALLTIGASVVLTAVVFYVCRPASSSASRAPRYGYRSTGERQQPATKRDDVVSWNIGRLLKPLNRSH